MEKEKIFTMDEFGPWLKYALAKQKMTQRDLADKLYTTEASISRYVNGGRQPRKEQLNAIMKAMGYHTEIRADREED